MSRCLHLHQILGYLLLNVVHFGAKCGAFCRKMECVLVLNGLRFGAKRKVKWYKMQGKMVLNAR